MLILRSAFVVFTVVALTSATTAMATETLLLSSTSAAPGRRLRSSGTRRRAAKNPLQADPQVIVYIGGSSTAGGGHIPLEYHYPHVVGATLQRKEIDMSHGATSTWYAVLNFNSLVPHDATHIVWEYGINDARQAGRDANSVGEDHMAVEEYRDEVRAFVDLVELHPNKPVLIFVFLWDTPFRLPHPATSSYDMLEPLLTNQLVVNVARDWVEATCKRQRASGEATLCFPLIESEGIMNETALIKNVAAWRAHEFVADYHHMNIAGHRFVADALLRIVKQAPGAAPLKFRPLREVQRHATLFGASSFDSKWRIGGGIMPLNLPRPMRTASLLFDTPRLPSEEARASSYAMDMKQKGKSTAWRRDRKNHGTMPLCASSSGAIDFATARGGVAVKIAPSERLAYVNIGEINDVGGDNAPGGDYVSYLYGGKNATLKAFWVTRDATIELKPNRELSEYTPINPADGSGCRYWFEQAADSAPLAGEGKVIVCTTNKKGGGATARWISALIVPTKGGHNKIDTDTATLLETTAVTIEETKALLSLIEEEC